MKPKKSYTALKGKVVSPVFFKHTEGKKAVAIFTLSDARNLHKCIAFGGVAEALNILIEGDYVTLSGGFDEEGKYVIEACLQTTETEENKPVARQLSPFDLEQLKEEEAQRLAMGYIKTKYGYKPENLCVNVDGVWTPMIEFLMDTLGPSEVEKLLKKNKIHISVDRNNAALYRNWLKETVDALRNPRTPSSGEVSDTEDWESVEVSSS